MFADNEDWAVRWAATRALRRLDTSAPAWLARVLRWPLPDEFLVDRLRDDSPYVRVEALATLIARGRPPGPRALALCLGSPHLDERWVALRALQVRNPDAFFGLWLGRSLIPDRDASRAEPSWAGVGELTGSALGTVKQALRDHGQTARTEVMDGLRESVDSPARWRQVAELLPRSDLPSASAVLGKRLRRNHPGLEHCPIGVIWWGLHHPTEAVRDWAYKLLSDFRLRQVASTALHGYIASLWPPESAGGSEHWSPRSVGERALDRVRRAQPEHAFSPPSPGSTGASDLAFDEAKAFRMASTPGAYSGSAHGRVSVHDLMSIDDFDTAWHVLATHEIPLQTEADMDGYAEAMKEGNFDNLIEMQMMAGSMNALHVKPLVEHLASICPQDGRKRLLDHIDHPSLGFWAEAILGAQPPARDILAHLGRSDTANRRIAQLASRGFLAEETAHRLIDLLLDGRIRVEPPEPRGSTHEPWWCARLIRMAGADAAIRLFAQDEAPAVQAWMVRKLMYRAPSILRGDVSASTRQVGAAWARRTLAEQAGDPLDRLALLVIGVAGDARDLPCLRAHARGVSADPTLPDNPAAEMPYEQYERANPKWVHQVELAAAAVRGLIRLGTDADRTWARSILNDRRIPDITLAVVQSMIEVWREKSVPWLMRAMEAEFEDGPAEVPVHYRLARGDSWRREAFVAIVGWGDRDAARRLARATIYDGWALQHLEHLGHLPEHALLGVSAEWLEVTDEDAIPLGFRGQEAAITSSKQLVERIGRKDREATRRAFIEFALDLEADPPTLHTDDESWHSQDEPSRHAMDHFEELGGFQEADRPLLREHLLAYPTSRIAILGLAELGTDEDFISETWRRALVPWWCGP